MLNTARWSTAQLLKKTCLAGLLGLQMTGVMLVMPNTAQAEITVETHDLLEFKYQQVGATEEEAIRMACIRAVHATIGRVLFSDYSLQAEDLLTPYIAKNWQQFVASYYVLERRADRAGFGVYIRVQTFPEKVHRDLREKRFLYKAEPNPRYAVFISETVNGQATPISNARLYALQTLKETGHRTQEAVTGIPGYHIDLVDNSMVGSARAAAIQAGAEHAFIGNITTRRVGEESVLLEDFVTYESHLQLALVRVNDGRVLGQLERTVRHSGKNDDEAASGVTAKAVRQSVTELVQNSTGIRDREVLDKVKFSVMFTDVTKDEVETIATYLQSTLSYGTKAFLKSWHGNVAILNIDTERDFSALERAIINYRQFDLRITDRQGKRITVQVRH